MYVYDAQCAYLFDVFVSVNIAFQMYVYIFYKTTDIVQCATFVELHFVWCSPMQ